MKPESDFGLSSGKVFMEIRVMVISHLPYIRRFVQNVLSKDHNFKLVSSVSNLMQAFSETEERQPKLALISPDFTRLAEFEMVRALFSALDVRWLIVSDENATGTNAGSTSGKAYGIFSVDVNDGDETVLKALRSLVKFPQAAAKTDSVKEACSVQKPLESATDRLILIGSSTGGVDALTEVLACFPDNCPPTFIVQHTGSSFGESLVRLLDGRCAARVVAAKNGMEVQPGMVCVGAGQNSHLHVVKREMLSCRLKSGSPVSGHMPSVDELFVSALPLAKRVVACLLTGMGRDGAEGLLELRKAGARTFVQDEGSSVVYGMPKAAWELGAAEKRVPITRMADTILGVCRTSTRSDLKTMG